MVLIPQDYNEELETFKLSMAGTAWRTVQSIVGEHINKTATATAIWQTVLKCEPEISLAMSKFEVDINNFDVMKALRSLLYADLVGIVPSAQHFYLWCVKDMLEDIEVSHVEKERMDVLLGHYGGFAEVPIHIDDALQPITGNMGVKGGRQALNDLIGHYAAAPPTRAQVIAQLLT